jgi:PIN domain nuclease of toxin-antitoxin system
MLLDSNVVFLWLTTPEAIAAGALGLLRDQQQRLHVSVATYWELEIKNAAERLLLTADFWPTLESTGAIVLDIERHDVLSAARLPRHHGDPFDRLIIAQAQRRGLPVMTRDRLFKLYDVPVIPA